MMPQDIILTAASSVLTVLLLPTVLDEDASVPRETSAPTSICLYAMAGTYLSLNLHISALVTSATASLWGIIAWKRTP